MPLTDSFEPIRGKLGRTYLLGSPIVRLSSDSVLVWKDHFDPNEVRYIKIDDEVFQIVRQGSCHHAKILRVEPAQLGTVASSHRTGADVMEVM